MFVSFGEYGRNKGNRKSRTGPLVRLKSETVSKKTRTPNFIALEKLARLLTNNNMEKSDIDRYREFLKNSNQIRYMNMPVLSEVIYYYFINYIEKGSNIEQSLKFFTPFATELLTNTNEQVLGPYVDKLINLIKEEKNTVIEIEIMRIRLNANMYRYLKYFLSIITSQLS